MEIQAKTHPRLAAHKIWDKTATIASRQIDMYLGCNRFRKVSFFGHRDQLIPTAPGEDFDVRSCRSRQRPGPPLREPLQQLQGGMSRRRLRLLRQRLGFGQLLHQSQLGESSSSRLPVLTPLAERQRLGHRKPPTPRAPQQPDLRLDQAGRHRGQTHAKAASQLVLDQERYQQVAQSHDQTQISNGPGHDQERPHQI
jgi:hypothetical protein